MRILRGVCRAILALPPLVGGLVFLLFLALIAPLLALIWAWRKLELFAVYEGDEDARDRAKWKGL